MRYNARSMIRNGLILIALLLIGIFPIPVFALSFSVNHNGDASDSNPGDGVCRTGGGVCTMRAAIEENNALGGGNTIVIPAMTITLTSNVELRVTQSATIIGAGQSATIIDGNKARGGTRVLKFEAYSGTHSVSNLTIQNARYTYSGPTPLLLGGGGIFNEATLSLTNVTLASNEATQGGGIFNAYAISSPPNTPSLTLNHVLINGNTQTGVAAGQGGGGLFNGSILAATQITITNNTAATQGGGFYNNSYQTVNLDGFVIGNNTAKYAGGINNDLGSSVVLSNGTISGNVSNCCDPWTGNNTGGGGIYNNDGTMTLTNVAITGNSATSPGGYAGGVYNFKNMTLVNVTITGNAAVYGAGVYNGNFENQPNSMTMTNVTISGNFGPTGGAQPIGGGIFNSGYAQLVLNNTTVTQNSAYVTGGLENQQNVIAASVTLRNTIIAGNSAGFSHPDCRGAIGTAGYNLIGNVTGCSFTPGGGDKINLSALLGALQNNGGATQTHALSISSPAKDAGNPATPGSGGNACAATDQRGIARPQSTRCDMGAYEFRPGVDGQIPAQHLPLIQKNSQ